MKRRIAAVLFAGLLVGGGAVVTEAAHAATQTCAGPMSGTINASLIVPSGSTCNLQGATVNGNVYVQAGGRLVVGGGSTINGQLASQNAGTDTTTNPFGPPESFSIIVCNSTITGKTNIVGSASQVLLGGRSTGGGGCGGNYFGDSVSLSGNHGVVTVSGNSGTCSAPGGTCRIRGSLTLSQNTGPNTVTNNDIAGNLNCFGNGSTVSGGNTAPAKNGQCPT